MAGLAGARVAVTGATGFIGRYLCWSLHASGAAVVAVVRRPERAADLAAAGIEVARADIMNPGALERAFAGADYIVANAALVSIGGASKAELVTTNVTGTENQLDAAAAAGVRRAVFVSSAVAYAPRRDHFYREDDRLLDEAGGHRLSYYAISKAAAERAAWRRARTHGITLSTVRPHTVFGAFDRGTFSVWLKRFMSTPGLGVFPVGVHLPAVFAGDLADAVGQMLVRDASRDRAYNLCHPPGAVSYWDLMQAYRRAGGRAPRVVLPFPVPIRRRYDTTRAQVDLDFRPRPLDVGFRDMVERERARTH
ncbi:MAG: NAD(P)-dependent oxidoreductase [Myxococcota bacterium]